MNPAFSRLTGRRGAKWFLLLLSFGLMLNPTAVTWATQPTYENDATVIYGGPNYIGNTPYGYPPTIDAANFINKGVFEMVDIYPTPYQTYNTLNFTNYGEMIGALGLEFDYGAASGGRKMAANFFNNSFSFNPSTFQYQGLIAAESFGLPNPTSWGGDPRLNNIGIYNMGYLWVSATNIINKGWLWADAGCEIKLNGTNVNLSRGNVYINSLQSIPNGNNQTNFVSDIAIYDRYWSQTNLARMNSWLIWPTNYMASAQGAAQLRFPVTLPCVSNSSLQSIGPFSPAVQSYIQTNAGLLMGFTTTNFRGAYHALPGNVPNGSWFVNNPYSFVSNIVRQAVFVYISDPNISGQIKFSPSGNPDNYSDTAIVQLTNNLSGDVLYLMDTFASSTNTGLLPNSIVDARAGCNAVTFRPRAYTVSRTDPGNTFDGGFYGHSPVPTNFFYSPTAFKEPSSLGQGTLIDTVNNFTNPFVSSVFAAYSCLVDNQASEPPPNPGGPTANFVSVTNLPGRININAANLNLFDTQLRGEGEIVIRASNLVISTNASVDCQNLSYNLGATNGRLNVINLASNHVVRFNGTVKMWSAVWTNTEVSVYTNNISVTNIVLMSPSNTPTGTNYYATIAPMTNFVQVNYYALVVDAGSLSAQAPVTVYDLLLHATNNVVISDYMTVVGSFLLDTPSFTLNGSLTFPGVAPVNPDSGVPFVAIPLQNWFYTMAPTLRYFTNNGSLTVNNDAHFGDDGPTNYLAFVNNGTITSGAQTINTHYLFINGGTDTATVGGFTAIAGTAILSNATITASGDINITAGTLLIDPTFLTAFTLHFAVTTNLSDGGPAAGNSFSCQNGFNLWSKPQTGDLWGTTITTIAPGFDTEVDHTWAGADRGANGAGFTNNASIGALVLSPAGGFYSPYYPLFYFSGTGPSSNGLYVGTLDLSQLGAYADLLQMLGFDSNFTLYYAHLIVGFTPPGAQTPEQYLDGQFGGHLRWVQNFTALKLSVPKVPQKLSASQVQPSGLFQLSIPAVMGPTYVVQMSTNLIKWVPVYTNSNPTNGLLQYLDSTMTNYPRRFYRVVTKP